MTPSQTPSGLASSGCSISVESGEWREVAVASTVWVLRSVGCTARARGALLETGLKLRPGSPQPSSYCSKHSACIPRVVTRGMFRQLHTRAIPSTTTAASVAARPKYHLPSYNLIRTCGPSTRPLQLINNLQLRGNIGINANAITNKQLHTTAAMASATGFYDFKPLDST